MQTDSYETKDRLKEELLRVQIESLRLSMDGIRQRLENRIDANAAEIADHEKRIRAMEEVATKFNFIVYLTMGGGLVGLLNLGLLAFTLLQSLSK